MDVDDAHQPIWTPDANLLRDCRMAEFARWARHRRGTGAQDPVDYDELWRWSVDSLDQFWADLASWAGVLDGVPDDAVLVDASMPGATWFPGRMLNYAEVALGSDSGSPALLSIAEGVEPRETSWSELRRQVGAFAATLRDLGVGPGDRVAAYLPNIPETVVAFLGTAAVGAVWSLCAPDFGARAALDRFAQIEPVVLLAVDGYRFNGREYDRRDSVDAIRAGLPTLRATIAVPRLHPDGAVAGSTPWSAAVQDLQEPVFASLPFDHPLWIVYSSGTTGLPKGIVHGHGGVVLEQIKHLALHLDVRPGDRFLWYASTAWIMWNVGVSALLTGATVVLYDGSPTYPSAGHLFAIAEVARLTHLGTSPGYLLACESARVRPSREQDLSALRVLGVTGAPLPATSYEWVREAVGEGVFLAPLSGGTDVATAFVGPTPLLPVFAGELQRPYLATAVEAWAADGRPIVGALGELVITRPMPSMPLHFWADADGARYRDAYFARWPGIWRHGDWIEFTVRGTCRLVGRSDATLNRGGVRMGTADIYAAIESIGELADSVVLGIEQLDGGYWMPLFVQLASGARLTPELQQRIREAVRIGASPRHVPDEIFEVPALPRTRTGKRIEIPLKRILQGVDVERAVNRGSLDNPDAVDWFADLARRRAEPTPGAHDAVSPRSSRTS